MTDADVVLAKAATMERCRARIAEILSPARQPHLLPVDVEDLLAGSGLLIPALSSQARRRGRRRPGAGRTTALHAVFQLPATPPSR